MSFIIKNKRYHRGMSLLEVMVVLGITMVVLLGATSFIILSFRNQRILNDQLFGQKDARRVISEIVNTIRTSEESSIGSYPVAQATTSSLTVYANIDGDSLRERVRYWLSGTDLKRGIIKPSGNPLSYTGQEQVTTIASYVQNANRGTPTFQYFTESYTGSQAAMTLPITITNIRMIKIIIEIEKDQTKSPVPLRVESLTHIRNLKTN
ncbi:MAG: prepilin-type N-terminal cleavage/methylation domain-containing protein [Candidatus Magasanikbacteria bacterium]|nr:prepilin-type N-terminal cleavage/methylation domain-containing protein [Candidatus Magasanikbacteria bacterium]